MEISLRNSMLFIIFLASVSFASINPKIQLDGYSVSEAPATPGSIINLTLNLKEIEWDYCADRVSVQLSAAYPLSIQGPDTRYLGSLCINDTDKGKVSFLIPVDSLAQSGTYQISSVIAYEKRFDKLSETNTLNIRVGGAASFVASITSSDPVDIYPGDEALITITFQNNGSSAVKSSQATLSASDGIEVKWAGKTQQIGSFVSHGSAQASFIIEAAKNIKPGAYNLDIKLDYMGEDQSNGTANFSFTIPIKPKADFSVKSNTELLSDDDKDVIIKIKNTGYDEAKSIKVKIKPIFPFSTDGTTRYIDSLKPGEEKNLIYPIHVDKDATYGDQILTVLFDFEDKNGKKYQDSSDFSLLVVKRSLKQEIMGYWYIGVIIILVMLIFIIKKLRKKK